MSAGPPSGSAKRRFLVAVDVPGDLALATYSSTTHDYAAAGHVRAIRFIGDEVSLAQAWWWERLPERAATAGLGEWELVRRQVSAYDPAVAGSSATSKPHYEQRPWHLRVRYERRADIHEAFHSLACALIACKTLKRPLC
jgi:hypothetical protein